MGRQQFSSVESSTLLEDSAHASGDPGKQGLTVRKDIPVALAGADGDYQPQISSGTGRTYVIEQKSGDIKAATEGMETDIDALTKSEDAVHANGDRGVMQLAVRKDTAAAVVADGDYISLSTDSVGYLRTLGRYDSGMDTRLEAIKTAVEILDNMISGSRGLVTEDNSAAIKTAVEAMLGVQNGIIRGTATGDGSADKPITLDAGIGFGWKWLNAYVTDSSDVAKILDVPYLIEYSSDNSTFYGLTQQIADPAATPRHGTIFPEPVSYRYVKIIFAIPANTDKLYFLGLKDPVS